MNWFNTREPRERVLLIVLAGLLVVFIAWFAMTRESGPDGATALEAAQTDRELWLRAAPRLGSGTANGERAEFTRGALVESARNRSVSLTRVQPQSNGALSVWIEDTSTTALYDLIEDIVGKYAVSVETALLTTAPNGGLNAQFTLSPT